MKSRLAISTAAIVLIIVIVLAIAGAAYYFIFMQGPPAEEFGGVIKIGVTVSLKGKYQREGDLAIKGMQLAVRWVNEHGGVKLGGKKYNITLVYYDDESSQDRVPQLYSKLVEEDQVDILLAPYSSTLTKAAAPVAEQYRKVIISHGGASDSIFQQGYKYAVQVLTPATKYLRSIITLLKEQNDPDIKIALIYENTAFSSTVAKGAREAIQEEGLNLVYEFAYEKGTQDFAAIIEEAKAAGANVLLGGGHFQDGVALTQQAWQLGWKLKAIGILVAPTLPDFYKQLGDAANGVMAPAQWEIGVKYSPEAASQLGIEWYGPTNEEYVQMYREMFGETPDYHAVEASAAIFFAVKAIEKAGSLDSDAIRAAANQVDIMTCFGRIRIDPQTGLQIAHQMVVIQWQNGEKKIIYPPEAAEAEPIYPAPNWWER